MHAVPTAVAVSTLAVLITATCASCDCCSKVQQRMVRLFKGAYSLATAARSAATALERRASTLLFLTGCRRCRRRATQRWARRT
eukprot:3643735-Pleurochrysis_carterae.AAC.1